jgi:hypothetical protein
MCSPGIMDRSIASEDNVELIPEERQRYIFRTPKNQLKNFE